MPCNHFTKGPGWETCSQSIHLSRSKKCSGWTGLSDWDSDDEELMDVCMGGVAGGDACKKAHHINTRDNVRIDSEHLLGHLQPLMEWIADDISM